MRALLVFIIACKLIFGQSLNFSSQGRDIPAGTPAAQLGFSLNRAPEVGDRFVITAAIAAIRATLVLPDGRRIDEAHSESAGLLWIPTQFIPPLGSTDGGHSILIEFTQRGRAGRYTFEFDARSATKYSHVDVQFITAKRVYDAMMRSLKGFQTAGPVTFSSTRQSATLDIAIARSEPFGVFDIVVTDPAATIALVLPGGRTLDAPSGKENGIEWKTEEKVEDIDPPGPGFGISINGFLLHRDGTHHVFMFETAKEGRYRIRAQTQKSHAEVTAAFIPIGRAVEEGSASLENLGSAPPGQVGLQMYAPQTSDCFVGDPIDLRVRLTGDPVVDPKFKVQVEYRTRQGTGPNGAAQWSEPSIEGANTVLAPTPEGLYKGKVIPSRPGLLRIGVQVTGKSTKGATFSDEALSATIHIHRVVARLGSFTEKTIRRKESDKLERLEITANLDVLVPGPYEMRLEVRDSEAIGLPASGKANLGAGQQTLTASIPAAALRRRFKDGPWTISGVQIFRPEGNTFGDSVATGNLTLKTAPYKRDQWDRGDAWSEEEVTVRGIYPANSGRFRMVEVELNVTTPGGKCSWTGSLNMDRYENRHIFSHGALPKGKTAISFVFDGAMVARAPTNQWYFSPGLNCDFGHLTEDHAQPLMSVTLDRAQFEKQQPSFFVDAQIMLRLQPGTSDTALIDVRGKKPGEVTVRVGDSAPGIDIAEAKFTADVGWAAQYNVKVTVGPNVKAGRYFIPIHATVGNETATTALVLDVIP